MGRDEGRLGSAARAVADTQAITNMTAMNIPAKLVYRFIIVALQSSETNWIEPSEQLNAASKENQANALVLIRRLDTVRANG